MSIRDLLVTAIVLGVLPFVFRHAYIGVLLWTWISIMNPHKLAWGFAMNMPFAAMAAGATLIALYTSKDRVQLPRTAPVVLLILFVTWTAITTAAAIDPAGSFIQLEKVFKIQLMTLVAIAVLHEKKHILLFIWVNVLSLGFFGFKGGIFTIVTAGEFRVWGPPGGFIEGNNELALALIIAIPLMYFLRLVSDNPWVRHGLIPLMLLSAIAAIGSQSRGAFLAIGAMAVFLWWRSPYKIRFGVPVAVLALVLIAFMPETWHSRMDTIQNYQQDESAMGRINAWGTMYNLANHRLLGGGFDTYTPEVFAAYAPFFPDVKAAHSIYFSVLGEHGWIGLGVFLTFWIVVWRTASRLRQQAQGREELKWAYHLAGMSQVSLVGYAVGGAFLSLAYFDLPYNVMVMLVVTQRWLSLQASPADSQTDTLTQKAMVGAQRGDARA
jgi:probable O-glycosylation ligase (exosortase A-associated)